MIIPSGQNIASLRLVFATLLMLGGLCASTSYSATVQDQHLVKPASVESEISFQAKDGWVLHGTLTGQEPGGANR